MAPVKRVCLLAEVGHEVIESTVAVDISARDAHAGAWLTVCVESEPGLERHVLEAHTAEVSPQSVRHLVGRHEHVGVAVVVEVRYRHAKAFACDASACARDGASLAYVLKCPIATVSVEHVGDA